MQPHSHTYFITQIISDFLPVDFVKNDVAEDQAVGDMKQENCPEEYLLPGVEWSGL